MKTIAFYDGDCIVCQTIHNVMAPLDWNNRIRWINLHDRAAVEANLPQINYDAQYDEIMSEIHVKTEHHGVLRGFQAARYLLGQIPLGVPVWAVLWLPGVDWLGDKAYRFISGNRYRINKLMGRDLDHLDAEQRQRAGL